MRLNVIALFSVFIGLTSSNVNAEINRELAEGLSNCLNISDDEQRLVCFDQLAHNNITVSAPIKVSDESVSKIEQVELEESKQVDDFSEEHLIKTAEEKGPESIIATISSVKQLVRGQWVFYFENGQKWQQQDATKIKLKVGESVRLKKGSMGVVYLFKEGSHRNIRVKRLK